MRFFFPSVNWYLNPEPLVVPLLSGGVTQLNLWGVIDQCMIDQLDFTP